jgi:quercetin dioxygenase-like cupin family protein
MTDSTDYFQMHTSSQQTLAKGAWFNLQTDVKPFEMVPGLEFRPVIGAKVALNQVSFEPHTEAPLHAHPEEQITVVLEGEFEFEVNGEKRLLRPGMVVVIPPNTPHAARTYDTRCVEFDIFHPPRQGLLDAMAALQEESAPGGED